MVKISKTYTPKEKEKYMCAKHLAYFKQKLIDWKSDLVKANNEALYNSSLDDNSTSADIVDQASSYTEKNVEMRACLLYTSPSPRDTERSRMPSSA